MSVDTFSPEELVIEAGEDQLSLYQFGSCVAKHYFCKVCGICPFHQSMRQLGHYRVNLGCLAGIDALQLPFEIFDGQSLSVIGA